MSYLARLMAQRGIDSAAALDDMHFLVVEKIGPKQSLTPEGFLLIQDTPVARVGWQVYAPQEIPDSSRFSPPPDGVFWVWRAENEVFAQEAMASANGKPIVDEHPETLITPDTHAGVPGVALDPRRGAGADEDVLIMDILVYNKDLIALIQDGKREISLGYDVDYEELEPGKLAQKNIRINHVALVDSGRCGPRCSIRDHSPPPAEEVSMARTAAKKKTVGSIFDAFRRAMSSSTSLSAKDREELEKAIGKEEDELPEALKEHEFKPSGDESVAEGANGANGPHIELHNHMPSPTTVENDDDDHEDRIARLESAVHELAGMIKEKLSGGNAADPEDPTTDDPVAVEAGKAILGQLELEAPPGAEQVDVRGAKDSRYLVDSFQATSAAAEIIAPGIRIPTFDKKGDPAKNFKVICDFRREALDLAHGQADTRGMIAEVFAGRKFDAKAMSCDAVRSTFLAVAAMKRGANNRNLRVGDGTGERRQTDQPVGGVKSLRDLSKLYADTYKQTA